jgi:hypothetical protein
MNKKIKILLMGFLGLSISTNLFAGLEEDQLAQQLFNLYSTSKRPMRLSDYNSLVDKVNDELLRKKSKNDFDILLLLNSLKENIESNFLSIQQKIENQKTLLTLAHALCLKELRNKIMQCHGKSLLQTQRPSLDPQEKILAPSLRIHLKI